MPRQARKVRSSTVQTVCNCHGMVYLDCPNRITAGLSTRGIATTSESAEVKLARLLALLEDRPALAEQLYIADKQQSQMLCLTKWQDLGYGKARYVALADRLASYIK